jgi:hypothetical protein
MVTNAFILPEVMVKTPFLAAVPPFTEEVIVIIPFPVPELGFTVTKLGIPVTFQLLFDEIVIVCVPPAELKLAVPVPTLTVAFAPV